MNALLMRLADARLFCCVLSVERGYNVPFFFMLFIYNLLTMATWRYCMVVRTILKYLTKEWNQLLFNEILC